MGHARDAHGLVGGGHAGVSRGVAPNAVNLCDVERVLLAPARDLCGADGLERGAADGDSARQLAPLEEVSLRDVGDNRLEQGVETVGSHESGVALVELAILEVERAEAHEYAVDERVDSEVVAAPVASQAERVERGVV